MVREPAKHLVVNDPSQGGRQATLRALAIAPGVMFVGVAGGIAFPILPVAGLRAGLSLPFIGFILAANRLARVFVSPAVGALSDRVGGRSLLLVGMVTQIAVMALYTLGVVIDRPGSCFLAARLLHGPASACVFVAAQVLALHAGGARHGGSAAGVVRAAMTAGMPLGLVVGGLLAERFGDRVTFETAGIAVVLATVLSGLLVPDLRAEHRSSGSLQGLVRVLSNRRVLAMGVLNFATFFSAQGTVLTTMVLLVRARGLSIGSMGEQSTASLSMGALILLSGIASVLAGRLADRLRASARFGVAGLAVLVVGLLCLMVAHTPAMLLAAVALVGLGTGAMNPCLVALLGRFVTHEVRGSAVGALQLFGDIGGTLGPVVGSSLFAYSTATPFLVSAVAAACAFPVGLYLVRAERATHLPTEASGSHEAPLPDAEL